MKINKIDTETASQIRNPGTFLCPDEISYIGPYLVFVGRFYSNTIFI